MCVEQQLIHEDCGCDDKMAMPPALQEWERERYFKGRFKACESTAESAFLGSRTGDSVGEA